MPSKPSGPPPEPAAEPAYPAIEALIEEATPQELEAFFEPVRAQLAQLKGTKAQQAKKVGAALESTQELLGQLLQIREKLADERRAGKGAK